MYTNDKLEKVNSCKLGKSIYKLIEGDGFNPCNSCDILHDDCKYSSKVRVSGILCRVKNVPVDDKPKMCRSCGRTKAHTTQIVEYVGKLHTVDNCSVCGAESLGRYRG